MSNRQKDAHVEKVEKRTKYYPNLDGHQLNARMENLSLVVAMLREELEEVGLAAQGMRESRHPEGSLAMRGAHLTITHFILERLFLDYAHDLELANKQADLIALTSPVNLIRPDGRTL